MRTETMLDQYKSQCHKRQKIIVSKDVRSKNPSKHTAHNQRRHCVYQYCLDDRTILKNSVPRCDYLLLNDDKKRAYFIEFKGKHIEKAKKQIESSIRLLAKDIEEYTKFYRIIYKTGTHGVRSAPMVHWIRECGRIGQVQVVVIKERFYEENIDF